MHCYGSSLRDRRKAKLQPVSLGLDVIAQEQASRQAQIESAPEFACLYDVLRVLGHGTTAVVRQAVRRSDGKRVALKCAQACDDEMRAFAYDEYTLLSSISHPNIVSVETWHPHAKTPWMCIELCEGGSLRSYVKEHGCFPEGHCGELAHQMFTAVDYLHGKRIVHRDVKHDNILLTGDGCTLKITDFNSAKQIGQTTGRMLTHRGTHSFFAPELHFGKVWNERVDIWSCGLCTFFMFAGTLPFKLRSALVELELTAGRLPPICWRKGSELMKNVILQCLAVESNDRPPAVELLHHPWFRTRGFQVCVSEENSELVSDFIDILAAEPFAKIPNILDSTPFGSLTFERHMSDLAKRKVDRCEGLGILWPPCPIHDGHCSKRSSSVGGYKLCDAMAAA